MQHLWAKGHTPVCVDKVVELLKDYPVRNDAILLSDGFTAGFRLNYVGPRGHVFSNNLLSTKVHKQETFKKLQEEVQLGRMLGPFSKLPISTLRISPIGLVPKSDGGWRLITHLSHPPGNSVNSYIDPEFCRVTYSSLDQILDKIFELGHKANLAKADIKSAFRLLPIHPADFELLGIQLDGKFFIEKNLPFGLSSSCYLWETFARFIQYLVESRSGFNSIDHYLDDYIFMGGAHTQECQTLMSTFMSTCNELQIPIAHKKSVGPTTVLPFLGYIIDTNLMMVLIPPEKISKLKTSLEFLLSRKKVTRKDLESVVGLMSFCSRAIPSSRAFLRRLYDLIAQVKEPFYRIRLGQELKSDIRMWLQFLVNFNGQCFFPEKYWISNDSINLFTDSSGNPSLGCGAYNNGRWAQMQWPSSWRFSDLMRNMSFLELVPIVLAMFLWAPEFTKKKILLHTDNAALCSIINKRTSKDKSIMKLIRPLVLLTMTYNVQFKAFHIESAKNGIADSLSRFQMKRFRRLAPTADQSPIPVPEEFLATISAL